MSESTASTDSSLGRVARGAATLTLFQFASKALLAVFFILIGNRALFEERAYGALEALFALVNVFLLFADLGLETHTIRKLSRDPDTASQWLPREAAVKVALTLAACALLLIWQGLLGERAWTVMLGSAVLLSSLSAQSYLRGIARARHRMEVEGLMGVVEKAATLGLGVAALFLGGALAGVLGAFAAGSALGAAYALAAVRKTEPALRVGLPPRETPSWAVLRAALPFALNAVCVSLAFNLDRIMLSFWSETWVASYSRGLRLVLAALLFPQMVSIALYPILCRLRDHREERLHVSRRSLQGLMLIALPIVTGGMALAGPLMDFLFGANLAPPSPLTLDSLLGGDSRAGNLAECASLRLLLLGLPFICGNYLFGTALNALDREHWNLRSGVVFLVVSIALNLAFIPPFGPAGAALATTLSQGVYCALLYIHLRRVDSGWIRENRMGMILALSVLMAVLLAPLGMAPVLARALIGALIYTGLLWAFGFRGALLALWSRRLMS